MFWSYKKFIAENVIIWQQRVRILVLIFETMLAVKTHCREQHIKRFPSVKPLKKELKEENKKVKKNWIIIFMMIIIIIISSSWRIQATLRWCYRLTKTVWARSLRQVSHRWHLQPCCCQPAASSLSSLTLRLSDSNHCLNVFGTVEPVSLFFFCLCVYVCACVCFWQLGNRIVFPLRVHSRCVCTCLALAQVSLKIYEKGKTCCNRFKRKKKDPLMAARGGWRRKEGRRLRSGGVISPFPPDSTLTLGLTWIWNT